LFKASGLLSLRDFIAAAAFSFEVIAPKPLPDEVELVLPMEAKIALP
jgi:hypothetical protein